MPNHQEKEENSTPRDLILWLFNVKEKEAELPCFEGFILFVGVQLSAVGVTELESKGVCLLTPSQGEAG